MGKIKMLKAIEDRLIILPDKPLPHKLIMDCPKNDYTNQGIVQSVGDKVTMVKIGDYVVFHRFDELPLPNDGLVVVRESSLLGKYDK